MSVRYKSTRGLEFNVSFEEVVLGGLAKDKGLYVPEIIPALTKQQINNVSNPLHAIYPSLMLSTV
jgi:threonine synthase